LTGDDAKAVELIGAIASPDIADRIAAAGDTGEVVLESRAITHPNYPGARVRTPVLLRVPAAEREAYGTERFGPITYFVTTADTAESLRVAGEIVTSRGA